MNRRETEEALSRVAELRSDAQRRINEFSTAYNTAFGRLLHEAAFNWMTPEDVARLTGLPPRMVRAKMRQQGLNPKTPAAVLSKQAGAALAENARRLGVDPHDINLMSPLAYLPGGDDIQSVIDAVKKD